MQFLQHQQGFLDVCGLVLLVQVCTASQVQGKWVIFEVILSFRSTVVGKQVIKLMVRVTRVVVFGVERPYVVWR